MNILYGAIYCITQVHRAIIIYSMRWSIPLINIGKPRVLKVNVREEIDAFTKLSFESEFQSLSPGGAISYVEVPNMQNNIPAILAVIKHIYENTIYAEINTKSDYCQVCGYDGEIKIVEDENNKLIWECPNCGNRDINKMNVVRRTCGLTA